MFTVVHSGDDDDACISRVFCCLLVYMIKKKVNQVLIVLICNQLYKEGNFSIGFVDDLKHAMPDCHF